MNLLATLRGRLAIATVAVAVSAAPTYAAPSADILAAPVLTAMGGPAYRTSAALSTSSMLDCSSANPYWGSNACNLSVNTQTAGCLWESQSTESSVAPERTPCQVAISGPVSWQRQTQFCMLYAAPLSLSVAYTIGKSPGRLLSPVIFQASAITKPLQFSSNQLSTRKYALTVYATNSPASASPGGALLATGTIKEVFEVSFSQPISDVCPNNDTNRTSIGAVRDPRPDVMLNDTSPFGFIKAEFVKS